MINDTELMRFLPSFPDTMRSYWDRNRVVAAERNLSLTPLEFAESFIDANQLAR